MPCRQLVNMVRADIEGEGWKITREYQHGSSYYFKCRVEWDFICVRISDHPPIRPVAISIHPGGDNRRRLLARLRSRRVSRLWIEWLNSK